MAVPEIDPTLTADKKFIIDTLAKVSKHGSITAGFATSADARRARRRMYHVAQQLAGYERQLFNNVELQLKGRMIVFTQKRTLSSTISPGDTNANPPASK